MAQAPRRIGRSGYLSIRTYAPAINNPSPLLKHQALALWAC